MEAPTRGYLVHAWNTYLLLSLAAYVYVVVWLLSTVGDNSYGLISLVWVGPRLLNDARSILLTLLLNVVPLSESLHVGHDAQPIKWVAKFLTGANIGDCINGVAVQGVYDDDDGGPLQLQYDYWCLDWQIYMVVNDDDFDRAVFMATLTMRCVLAYLCPWCTATKLRIYRLQYIAKQKRGADWTEIPAAFTMHGKSRTGLTRLLDFMRQGYTEDMAVPMTRVQRRTPIDGLNPIDWLRNPLLP